jgi:alkylhydroperoxidase family enzyme
MGYAKKLIQKPSMIEDSDFEDLRAAGWDERGVYETTALISLFNYSGRMEAASGLPVDRIPEEARIPEATPGKPIAA